MKLILLLGAIGSLTFLQSEAFSVGSSRRGTNKVASSSSKLSVASVDSPSVTDMERGVGGRIENAFAEAKEKGEAAFVTFVTAGYPTADGKVSTAMSSKHVYQF